MKVTIKNPEYTRYGDIKQGETFIYQNDLFIKIDKIGQSGIACIRLSLGATYNYSADTLVRPVSAEVVAYD